MRSTRTLAIAAISLTAMVALSSQALASVGVDVRVLRTDGRALAQLRQFTDTVNIKTDPGANCFGSGSGGSGNTVVVNGSTALGVVQDGTVTQKALRPLSV